MHSDFDSLLNFLLANEFLKRAISSVLAWVENFFVESSERLQETKINRIKSRVGKIILVILLSHSESYEKSLRPRQDDFRTACSSLSLAT